MLHKATNLKSYALSAVDGQLGKINQFYFDDESWVVRYAVVDTGLKADPTDSWFTGRQVLLPPSSLGAVSAVKQLLTTNLSRKEIQESPGITTDPPVSRQSDEGKFNSLGWPVSWYSPDEPSKPWDPHLRSTKEVMGYHIQANDGELGHVDDFILDDETWTIRYIVIATRNWLPGKRVLISPRWIKEIHWDESKMLVNLSSEQIQNSLEFTDDLEISRSYEEALFAYYQQEYYWTDVENVEPKKFNGT